VLNIIATAVVTCWTGHLHASGKRDTRAISADMAARLKRELAKELKDHLDGQLIRVASARHRTKAE
jgi:hypothetical protein